MKEYFKKRVEQLAEIKGDNEVAHMVQDQLLIDALRYIAQGIGDTAGVAQVVLGVLDVEFDRWYA